MYLIFFLVGVFLFGLIALFTIYQVSKVKKTNEDNFFSIKNKGLDPLFDNLSKFSKKNKKGVKTTKKQPSVQSEKSKEQQAEEEKTESSAHQLNETEEQGQFEASTQSDHQTPPSFHTEESDEHNVLDLEDDSKQQGGKENTNKHSSDRIIEADTSQEIDIKRDENSKQIIVDWVARIKNEQALEQKNILDLFGNYRTRFESNITLFGFNQMKQEWGNLELEQPSARYVEFGLSLQLADFDLVVSSRELIDFQQMVLDFANHLEAPFEFSMDIEEAQSQVNALSQLRVKYDAMIMLYIVPRTQHLFRVADIESCCRDLGLSISKDGVLQKTTGGKNNLTVHYRLISGNEQGYFSLNGDSEQRPINRLMAYMSIPATYQPDEVLETMIQDTKSLATWLEAKVVDKQGKVMTQKSYTDLLQQTSDVICQMQTEGLTPGDPVCKRLFN